MKKILSLALVVVMALAMFVGCSSEVKLTADGTIAEDSIKFGTNAEFEPFEYIDNANGVIENYAGIDMEIIAQVGKDMGKEVKVENMEFGALLAALESGKVDAVISGMTITEDRKKTVDFSEPYYVARQYMIVKEGSAIAKAADMKGKKIAVMEGYTGETIVRDTLKESLKE